MFIVICNNVPNNQPISSKELKFWEDPKHYEAWFTEDIPVSDGPVKFNGLPGLILRVRLVDPVAVWDIEAIELRTEKTSRDIANPYDGKSIVPYEQYRREYIAKHKEFEFFQDDNFKVVRGGVEIIE